MNIFVKTDQMFEAAARNRDSSDKLLNLLRRRRAGSAIGVFGLAILLMGLCVWGLVLIFQFLNSPRWTAPPYFQWVLSHQSVIWVCASPLLTFVAVQFVLMLHFDSCLKLLLFLRAQQTIVPDDKATPATPIP